MTHKRKIAVVEGFGSGERTARYARKNLEQHTDYDDVVVFSYGSAINNLETVAESIDGADVSGHSAGAHAIRQAVVRYPDVQPQSVTMVAPPVPVGSHKLIARANRVARNEARASLGSFDHARINVAHTLALGGELGRHALTHLGLIRAISRFDAFEFGNELVERGIETWIVAMEDDEFFAPASPEFQRSFASRDTRMDVVLLEGRHCRFAQRPAQVLGEIAMANAAVLQLPPPPDETPGSSLVSVPA